MTWIFDCYLTGDTLGKIAVSLEQQSILSPSGRTKWNRKAVGKLLSNEKYTGDVKFLKSGKSNVHYLASENNSVIISKETFEAVQIEKGRRSNVVKDENGNKRKREKYSSKRK